MYTDLYLLKTKQKRTHLFISTNNYCIIDIDISTSRRVQILT